MSRHLITGDVNGDGHDDVIISAPGFSSAGNYQQGRVYIIYGLFCTAYLTFVGTHKNTGHIFCFFSPFKLGVQGMRIFACVTDAVYQSFLYTFSYACVEIIMCPNN